MKKNQTKRYLAFLIALLLVFPLLFTGCGKSGDATETATETKAGLDPINPFPVGVTPDFTVGELKDGVYTNTWAGIKIAVPFDLSQGNDAQYASVAKDENTACGLYLSSANASQSVFIGFQALPGSVGAEAYLNTISDTLREKEKDLDGVDVVTPSSYSFVNLGGNEYIKGSYQYVGAEKTAYQDYYVRELDDIMIFIVCTADSTDKTADLAGLIRPCH